MNRRAGGVGAGLGLAALYVVVVVATSAVSNRPVRPLFDGFAPPSPYKWVNPPPGLEKDNEQPAEATLEVPLGADGSMPTNSATADGQAIAGLDTASVPGRPPDTNAALRVKPFDPGRLGPLPEGLRAESNAYQVTITYQPSGTPLTALAKPGTIALTAAAPASSLLYSADGARWETVEARAFGDSNGLFAPLNATGYYLSVSHNAPRTAPKGKPASRANLVVGLLMLAVVGAIFGVLLSNRGAARRSRPPGGGRAEPKGKSRGRRRRR